MAGNAFRGLLARKNLAQELPRIPGFDDVYGLGCRFHYGQEIMIAGRSGSQKSGLALYMVSKWNLPTLYFSADMSASTAASRVASIVTGKNSREIDALMETHEGADFLLSALERNNITFCHGNPITWHIVEDQVNNFVTCFNEYPRVVVFDNLMDFSGSESDYQAQMAVMNDITSFTRQIGCVSIVLHHATDKSSAAVSDPSRPPARSEIKNGVAEKPELVLTVGLKPPAYEGMRGEMRVAVVKQREGTCDPSAQRFAVLSCDPSRTWFGGFDARNNS